MGQIKYAPVPGWVQEAFARGSTLVFTHSGQQARRPDIGGHAGGHYAPRSRMHFAVPSVGTLPAGDAPSLSFGTLLLFPFFTHV